MPKVLIADELSSKALNIFRSCGVEADVCVGLRKPDRHADSTFQEYWSCPLQQKSRGFAHTNRR
jgi:hypothetical protein